MYRIIRTGGLAGLLCVAAVALPASAPAVPADYVHGAAASNGTSPHAARKATAKFRRLARAKHAGYALLKDADGISCIDMPGEGGMGVHFVNGDLVGTADVTPTTPEALVYEPKANGRKRLVALEYVVFQEAWDKAHSHRPRVFGHRFKLVPEGNRYGLPAFYERHAWVWKHNPSGKFSDFNPNVSC
ncbi:MAG: hypothetical protein QOI80_1523 [Solirubrobacteraceae bacterium]|jgi:hypothetical protein|nr:hypothetical protein [Solirubrobacteraceae bacterium]